MHHGDISQETAKGLKVLRARIRKAKIPPSKLDETLNVATWNIREFGRVPRKEASLHYVAEIIGQFDLVCLVELRDDLNDLAQVMKYLGPYWSVVYSDYNEDRGGNRERLAFVYDTRAATFTGLASNIHAPRKKAKSKDYVAMPNWWRQPYIGSFRAGNFDFAMLTAHIRWGKNGKAGEKERLPEIKLVADWVARRVKKSTTGEKDIIVAGDFNIPSTKSVLYKAITAKRLKVPKALLGDPGSNLERDKRYDQILHLESFTKAFSDKGGVLDFFDGDHTPLAPKGMSKDKWTYELSDHLPLWVQLNTDNDAEQLDQILNPKKAAP